MPRALCLVISLAILGTSGCGAGAAADEVEVRVGALAVDTSSNSPVVILEELSGQRRLPIWIGHSEAYSIAAELEEEEPVRPNTHDLAKRLLDRLDGVVRRVVVTRLDEGVYYAEILLDAHGRELVIDARPSDAIALALRCGARVFVREAVLEGAALKDSGQRIRIPVAPEADRQVPIQSL